MSPGSQAATSSSNSGPVQSVGFRPCSGWLLDGLRLQERDDLAEITLDLSSNARTSGSIFFFAIFLLEQEINLRRLGSRWYRSGCGRERLLHDAQHLLAAPLYDRHQSAELESRELDVTGTAQGLEAELREEVRREDRLVHLEALVLRLTFRIAVRKRLQRL